MDVQRLQGLVFLLSTAGLLAMPGCDPEPEEETPTGSTGDEGTVCERLAAMYVECFPGENPTAEQPQECEDWTAYLGDISQECADTFVVMADCLSRLDCAEVGRGCEEETTAHATLLCVGF